MSCNTLHHRTAASPAAAPAAHPGLWRRDHCRSSKGGLQPQPPALALRCGHLKAIQWEREYWQADGTLPEGVSSVDRNAMGFGLPAPPFSSRSHSDGRGVGWIRRRSEFGRSRHCDIRIRMQNYAWRVAACVGCSTACCLKRALPSTCCCTSSKVFSLSVSCSSCSRPCPFLPADFSAFFFSA